MLNRFSQVRRQAARLAGYALMAVFVSSCGASDGGTITQTPAISIALGTGSGSITAGGTSSFSVTVGRSGSFSGSIDLSVEGLPSGVTASVSPASVVAGATTATVTLTALPAAAATTATLTVRAKGSGVTDATSTYALTVQAAAASGGFSLSLSPASASITAGTLGTTTTVTIARTGSFTGAVNLSVGGAPAGVTTTLSSASVAGTTATLTIDVTAAAAAGVSTLTITGTGTGVSNATATYSLTTVAAATGSFAVSLAPTTLSVAAGASGTSTVTIARTAPFTGAVNLAVSGAPAGVTATLSAASVATGATTATLTVAVAAGTAATTGTIVVTGTAAGVANATASLALTTTATGTTPGTGSIVFRFCTTPVPTWFAVQDGVGGTWTKVNVGTGNTYSFNLENNLGGVAYATVNGTAATTNVYYGTKAEITARGINDCPNATTKDLTGTMAGLGAGDQGYIGFANRSSTVIPSASLGYSLKGVADGAHDLVAGRVAVGFSGTSITSTPNKFVIRRAINPTGTIPVIDFGSEGFAPSSGTLSLGNLGSDQSLVTMIYLTANGTYGLLYSDGSLGGSSRTIYGVPAGQQIAGDLHVITFSALNPAAFTGADPLAAVTLRTGTYLSATPNAPTITLGPILATPTVTTVATAPYVRLKSVLPRQAEYNQTFFTNFQQSGTASRGATIEATVTWVGAGSFDATIPDFSAVSGWDNAWGLKTGVATVWTANSTGYSGATLQPAAAGYTALTAQKAGSITP